jgi:hypothetical protein
MSSIVKSVTGSLNTTVIVKAPETAPVVSVKLAVGGISAVATNAVAARLRLCAA